MIKTKTAAKKNLKLEIWPASTNCLPTPAQAAAGRGVNKLDFEGIRRAVRSKNSTLPLLSEADKSCTVGMNSKVGGFNKFLFILHIVLLLTMHLATSIFIEGNNKIEKHFKL